MEKPSNETIDKFIEYLDDGSKRTTTTRRIYYIKKNGKLCYSDTTSVYTGKPKGYKKTRPSNLTYVKHKPNKHSVENKLQNATPEQRAQWISLLSAIPA